MASIKSPCCCISALQLLFLMPCPSSGDILKISLKVDRMNVSSGKKVFSFSNKTMGSVEESCMSKRCK